MPRLASWHSLTFSIHSRSCTSPPTSSKQVTFAPKMMTSCCHLVKAGGLSPSAKWEERKASLKWAVTMSWPIIMLRQPGVICPPGFLCQSLASRKCSTTGNSTPLDDARRPLSARSCTWPAHAERTLRSACSSDARVSFDLHIRWYRYRHYHVHDNDDMDSPHDNYPSYPTSQRRTCYCSKCSWISCSQLCANVEHAQLGPVWRKVTHDELTRINTGCHVASHEEVLYNVDAY